MVSDRELIDRYRAGGEEAFSELYGRHRKQVFVYLLSWVRSRDTAEELLQETFLSFLKGLDRLDGSEDLRPFLIRTARNLAIDWLRRKRTGEKAIERRAADPLFRRSAGGEGAGEPGDAEVLSELILELPEEQREAVLLKVFAGMTFAAIGRLQGCPENTALSRYRYGIEKLRARLEGRCDDGAPRPSSVR